MGSLFLNYSADSKAVDGIGVASPIPGQVYTTPNIVLPTVSGTNSTPWIGGVYQDSLTCWGWGNPGYCGPNPIVRPGNNINFSFGIVDLHQVQSIANALPNSGTGLKVEGFNFGFTAKNGNGWDDGRLDVLSAYTRFYNSSGSVVEDYNYNLNYRFNWTTFNYSETFKNPYASQDLSFVRYGFVGGDNNFWAGPYGPEVTNISFSLKYSVDPCSVNVLSSPSCSGYADAIFKITESSKPVESVTPVIEAPKQVDTSSTETIPQQQIQSQPQSSQQATQSSSRSVSLTQILGIIATEQSRISNVERSVVRQANQSALREAERTQRLAETVASDSQKTSIAASMMITDNSAEKQSSAATINFSFAQPSIGQQAEVLGSGITIFFSPQNKPLEQTSYSQFNFASPSISYSLSENQYAMTRNFDVETPTQELPRFGVRPMIEEMSERPEVQQQSNQQSSTESSRRNVTNNELAGGVDIAALAIQPRGFSQYSVMMPDSPFYEPKEIYRNQRTIDNTRVLRGLMGGSDRLHQEMVNQQYNR